MFLLFEGVECTVTSRHRVADEPVGVRILLQVVRYLRRSVLSHVVGDYLPDDFDVVVLFDTGDGASVAGNAQFCGLLDQHLYEFPVYNSIFN